MNDSVVPKHYAGIYHHRALKTHIGSRHFKKRHDDAVANESNSFLISSITPEIVAGSALSLMT